MTNTTPHKPVLGEKAGRQAVAFGLALAITALGVAGINTATMPREEAEPTSWQLANGTEVVAPARQAQISAQSPNAVARAATAAADLAAKVGAAR